VPDVVIPAHETRFFVVNSYKSQLGGASFGGTVLTHTGPAGSLVANGTTLSMSTGLSFDSPFVDPTKSTSTELHCPWWDIRESYQAYVTMKNTSESQITATVTLYYDGGSYTVPNIVVPAQEVRLLSIRDYASQLGGSYGGIVVTHTGSVGSLVANTTVINGANGISYDAGFECR